MRDFLNLILEWIGATSLTDVEYDAIDQDGLTINVYNQALYDALAAVLVSRAAVSTTKDRLTWFFKAKGVAVDESTVTPAKSNVFIGASLE